MCIIRCSHKRRKSWKARGGVAVARKGSSLCYTREVGGGEKVNDFCKEGFRVELAVLELDEFQATRKGDSTASFYL